MLKIIKYNTILKQGGRGLTIPRQLQAWLAELLKDFLFRNKDSANIIINHYKNKYRAHYFVFNTKKNVHYKKVNWEKALEYIKEYPEKEKQHA